MSNMVQSWDEISCTHDSLIVGTSNAFEVLFKTLTNNYKVVFIFLEIRLNGVLH